MAWRPGSFGFASSVYRSRCFRACVFVYVQEMQLWWDNFVTVFVTKKIPSKSILGGVFLIPTLNYEIAKTRCHSCDLW